MTRLLAIVPVLALLVFGVWWFRGRATPEARIARPYVQRFAHQLQNDHRFTKIDVGVWELGSKGPLYVRGRVGSDSDAAELRRTFDALACPVGVSWQVVVDTNLSGGVR